MNNITMHPGPRRIGDNHIGSSTQSEEILIENILYVARNELRIRDTVLTGIDPRIGNSLVDVLYPRHLRCPRRQVTGDCSRTGIEVIHVLIAPQLRELPHYSVELRCLEAVGLVERLRSYPEPQSLHRFSNIFAAAKMDRCQIGDAVVLFRVNDIPK